MFEIFKAYQFNSKKAKEYGFLENKGVWTFSSTILHGDFLMRVIVVDGDLSFQVFDQETGDLYPQVHMESLRGTFVGSVRETCLEVLYDIRKSCFEVQEFLCSQTKRIMTLVQAKYENQLEYLWEKSPDTAVLRHEDNQKWYAVLMKISWEKLDKAQGGQVEVVNLKHDQVADLLLQKGIYPAFHMNKRYWISLPLDDTLSDEQVLELFERSWDLTRKKK
ncbi:MmcQ/YjbR family DNA-binding protein [Streptococcus sp. V869]